MSLLPEIRRELLATATRNAVAPRRGSLSGRRWRVPAGGLAIALSGVCALAVAVVLLLTLGHRVNPARPGHSPSSSVGGLESRLAILRRPQTPADRTIPAYLSNPRRGGRGGVISTLTRLAATLTAPGAGQMRVYVIVRRFRAPIVHAANQGRAAVSAIAVGVHGRESGTRMILAGSLGLPGNVGSGLYIAGQGLVQDAGAIISVVPDGVSRVRWVFTGAGFGVRDPRPLTISAQVHNNVAVAPARHDQGPLRSVTWFGSGGQILISGRANAEARGQLATIGSVNASRARRIAASLLAHYSLFRSYPADSPARDHRLPKDGSAGGYVGQMRLNYWQSRYVGSLTGLDGRGIWITPGARGICISDPQTSACGMLTTRDTSGFTGPATTAGQDETLSGVVPDGNTTVTLVLTDGRQVTTPVIHNVYEATVHGHISAIIDRNTAGRIIRRSLR